MWRVPECPFCYEDSLFTDRDGYYLCENYWCDYDEYFDGAPFYYN